MKMFLASKGSIHIEDVDGLVVSFNSPEEYNKYTGKTAPEEYSLAYEPDRGLYTTFDGINTQVVEGINSSFEADIMNVALYKDRQDNKYYGATLEESYTAKQTEIRVLGYEKQCAAELNPQIGVNLTVSCMEAQAIRQLAQEDFANKLAGEVVLIQDEKDEAKAYQKLTEFYRKINEDMGKAQTNVEKLDTVAEVEAFDIINDVVWTVWTPPT